MPTFDFYLPTRILFGPGRLRDLEHTPFLPKGARALIVVGAGGSMLTEGHLARVQGLLAARGVASMVYDRIPARLEAYVQWIGARRPERLDLLTRAMGGGENGGPDDGAARFRSAWKALTDAIGLAPEMGPTRCCTKAQLDRWTGNALASMGGHPEAAWRAMRQSDMAAVITEALGAGDVSRTGT